MTIAESIKNYYESDDFKDNYAMYLFEDTSDVKDKIKDVCKSYEFNEYYGKKIDLTDEQTNQIFEYVCDNEESFTKDMHNAYVGYTCIASICFGEQEEQLTDIYNHKTGKSYTLPYLKKCFDNAGYCINGDYAYYDMSYDGIYIDLLAVKIPLLVELTK